jgi:hypothetical protein
VRSLDDAELVRWRADSSLLARRSLTPSDAVSALLGLQAQDLSAFRLSVRARTASATDAGVIAALHAPARLVRTWAMRGTLHLVTAADLPWLVALFGPRLRASTVRRRRELGIPDDRCEAALPLLEDILGDGPLPRAAIVTALNDHGFAIAAGTQAVPHLLGYAASFGLLCCGPGETFALVDQWLAPGTHPVDPLAELARRYLVGHGPADTKDLAAWSGLPLSQCRAGFAAIEDELHWVTTGSGPMAALAQTPPEKGDSPLARLLPRYDGYLLGWRDRDLVLDPAHRRAIHPGGGVLNAALTIDGVVHGSWSISAKGRSFTINVDPFTALTRRQVSAVEADAADVGRFLARDVDLVIRADG